MPRSRKSAWLKEEIVLALDLYLREGMNAAEESLHELSETLRALPVEEHLAAHPEFRSPSSVASKLANFRAIESDNAEGRSHYSALDRDVYERMAGQPDDVSEEAARIRAFASEVDPELDDPDEGGDSGDDEFEEGRLITKVHRSRERNRSAVRRKKDAALRAGRMACEACNTDYTERFGTRGRGVIECHHKIAISELDPESNPRLSDLALLCANCHRLVHSERPWLRWEELLALVGKDQPEST